MNDQLISSNMENNISVIQFISELLLNLGLKPNLKGFCYIKEAVIIYPTITRNNKSVKDIYAEIAENHNVNARSVERAIRIAIESAWYNENKNLSHVIFNFPYITAERSPTNAEFIATMSEIIYMKFILGSRLQ